MKKWWFSASRCLLIITIFGLAACSGPEKLQIELEEKRALHDQKKADVERRIKAIESGRYEEADENQGGGGGVTIGRCLCTYKSRTTPPVSCSDPRCGPVTY